MCCVPPSCGTGSRRATTIDCCAANTAGAGGPDAWAEDFASAAKSYKEDSAHVKDQLGDAVRKVREAFAEGFRRTS
jgi:hypothetical protein